MKSERVGGGEYATSRVRVDDDDRDDLYRGDLELLRQLFRGRFGAAKPFGRARGAGVLGVKYKFPRQRLGPPERN